MKDANYFSHDYNARNDEKIRDLMREHGMIGYGLFWAIVEELYHNTNVLRTQYKRIAYDLRTDEILVKSVVEDFGLFVIKDGFFSSNSIQRRIEQRQVKSAKARESIKKRWDSKNTNVSKNDTNVSKNDTINKERKKEINKDDDEVKKNVTIDRSFSPFQEQGKDQEKDVHACGVLLKSNDMQIQSLGIKFRIPKESLSTWIDQFIAHLGAHGKGEKSQADFNKHFNNWMSKQNLSEKPKEQKVSKTMTSDEFLKTLTD